METRITYLISYNAINLSNETTFSHKKKKKKSKKKSLTANNLARGAVWAGITTALFSQNVYYVIRTSKTIDSAQEGIIRSYYCIMLT